MAVTVHEVTEIHRGRVFRLTRENVTLDNGVTIDIDLIRHPGAAAIVPLDDDNRVVMVRQYRHAVGGYIWEIPAGTLNPGEAPLACAQRELAEEAGLRAEVWSPLGAITPLPGYADERIFLFLCIALHDVPRHLDADEVLEPHRIPMAEVLAMIDRDEIQDAKTIAAITRAARRLGM